MNEREQKALVIAAKNKLVKKGDTWIVPSQSGDDKYKVNNTDPDWPTCTCIDFELRRARCKHIYAVEYTIEREEKTKTTKTAKGEKTVTTVTETVKIRYKQVWSAYNNAQTNEKARFLALLSDLCSGIDEPIQTMGRTRIPMADMLFAAVYKIYSSVSSRRFMSDLKEEFVKGRMSKMPCYNSINNYIEDESMTPYLQALITLSSLPLKSVETAFAVDSSGFSTCQYQRWYDEKYGKEQSKQDWVKAHVMCGVKTNIVTSAEISSAHVHDTNFFAPLVNETGKHFDMREVSADKAYSNYANMRVVEARGAVPYIDFKVNASDKGKCEVWNRMYHFYQYNREAFMEFYHKRSNVETTFSMIKAKFGGFVRAKLPTAQVNEVLCKILCHNLCVVIQSMAELGIEANFWNNAA